MPTGLSEWLTFDLFLRLVIVEPAFTGLETRNNVMAGRPKMLGGVAARGAVATADMSAFRATPQVQPPSMRSQTFDAPISGGLGLEIDPTTFRFHCFSFKPGRRYSRPIAVAPQNRATL
jgi:hypothetical protein